MARPLTSYGPDPLRSRQTRPEASYDAGDGLPDLLVTAGEDPAPEEDVPLADAVGQALLVVLDSLGPAERLALVLHDLFAVPFEEVARILDRSTPAAKMLAGRAHTKLHATGRPPGAAPEQRAVVRAFLAAARDGDFEELLRLLDPDVELTVRTPAGPGVTLGATKVAAGARLASGAARSGRPVLVNGLPGVVSWYEDGTPLPLLAFTVTGGRITELLAVVDPAALARLEPTAC